MLISHRSTAYIDTEELERAAGLLEIDSKNEKFPEYWRDALQGGAAALRILQLNDIKSAYDFKRAFDGAVHID